MKPITTSNNWKEFEQSLESLGKTEKGRAFEELTRLHLLTDPTSPTPTNSLLYSQNETTTASSDGICTAVVVFNRGVEC